MFPLQTCCVKLRELHRFLKLTEGDLFYGQMRSEAVRLVASVIGLRGCGPDSGTYRL